MSEASKNTWGTQARSGRSSAVRTTQELAPRLSWIDEVDSSDHVAQFYESDSFLISTLCEFIGSGLRAGEGIIVVATQAHCEELEARLQADGLDLAGASRSRQYVCLDAAETLAKIMCDGMPDPLRFAERFSDLVEQSAAGRPRLRVFGEMVALLWSEGSYAAALRLEELWNKLRERHPFLLFCAYPIHGLDSAALDTPLSEVCAEHSRVIPAESYTNLSRSDDRLRAIVLLQERASLLEAEIAERQTAEKRLRVSEIRYRRLFEASADGILIIDPITRRISDANPALAELLEMPHQALIGKELWEIGLLIDEAATLEVFQALQENGAAWYDNVLLQSSSGRQRDLELVSTRYQANGHQVIQCTLRDITRRKQAEAALRALKAELEVQVEDLRRLHEMSAGLTGILDIDSVLREVLRAALAVQCTDLGLLSLADPRRDGLTVKVHSGFNESFLTAIAWIPAGTSACQACLQQRRRLIIEDVELDPSFAPHREAARAAGIRSCFTTPLITRGGVVIGVLSAYFRQPHRPAEREMRLMDLYARMAADSIENAQLHHLVQEELEERKQLLAGEQRARAEAESMSRMKDEFLATVSHELRTPLTTIIGWAQRLRSTRRDEASVLRGLQIIEQHAKAQAQLIADILDVSQIITGKLQLNIGLVDVAAVINAAIDSVQLAAEAKDIQLAVMLDPSARHISGDASRLQQVFWNLLSNAVKFTPGGGRISVLLERAGPQVEIRVSDTGEGIQPDFLPFIFDRFRQADGTATRRHGGLGLGLAIVRHLVELHGGSVSAESAGEGGGSTFTIRLPLARNEDRSKGRTRLITRRRP